MLEIERCTILKNIFMITFFDHCNVLSRCITYALDFFIASQTLLRIKIQNLHIYQISNISSNFHAPSLLHHLFTSFNFLMMVCNMRHTFVFSYEIGMHWKKTREIWLFLLSYFSLLAIETQKITSFQKNKKKTKKKTNCFLAKVRQ